MDQWSEELLCHTSWNRWLVEVAQQGHAKVEILSRTTLHGLQSGDDLDWELACDLQVDLLDAEAPLLVVHSDAYNKKMHNKILDVHSEKHYKKKNATETFGAKVITITGV